MGTTTTQPSRLADRQRRAHVRATIVRGHDPLGRVRKEDVQVAAADPAHGPARQVRSIEDRDEGRFGRAERPKPGWERCGSRIHLAASYRRDERRPRWVHRGRREEERGQRRQATGRSVVETARAAPSGAGTCRTPPAGAAPCAGTASALLVRSAMLVHHRRRDRRDGRAGDTEPERLGDREAERRVAGLDDRLDDGCASTAPARRSPGPRHRRRSATLKSIAPACTAAKKSAMTLGGTPAEIICGESCSWKEVAKIVPTKARATVPPIWRKKVKFDVATPSSAERHGVLDDDREDRERRPDAETGQEHPQPDDRQRGVRAFSWVMNRVADADQDDRPDQQPLVATGARHEEPGHDGAEDQPDHQGQRGQARIGR